MDTIRIESIHDAPWPFDGGRLLAPWSERVRFGMMKNGYHGGAAGRTTDRPAARQSKAALDVA